MKTLKSSRKTDNLPRQTTGNQTLSRTPNLTPKVSTNSPPKAHKFRPRSHTKKKSLKKAFRMASYRFPFRTHARTRTHTCPTANVNVLV